MESRGEKPGKFHKKTTFEQSSDSEEFAEQIEGSVSDSKGGLCKDDTLEIAGHRTWKVGKCHLSGAKHFILQAVENFKKF